MRETAPSADQDRPRMGGLRREAMRFLVESVQLAETRKAIIEQMSTTSDQQELRGLVRQYEELTIKLREADKRAQDWLDMSEDMAEVARRRS